MKQNAAQYVARIYDMRTNDLCSPIGVSADSPVFSWKVESTVIGWLQKAYQIVVKHKDTVVWDSGMVHSWDSVGIVCDSALSPCTAYTWTVTVWDQQDNAITGNDTFETALPTENPFGNAQWISHADAPLYTGTQYTIDFDFIIDCGGQGFCFHMTREAGCVMLHINAYEEERVMLTPYVRKGSNWNVWPDMPDPQTAYDITEAIGYNAADVIGKKIHQRIIVDGATASVYFGKDENSLVFAAAHTFQEPLELLGFGFRRSLWKVEESVRYANLVIREADGTVIYENGFSKEVKDFRGPFPCKVEDGMLCFPKIGGSGGEHIYYYDTRYTLPAFRKSVYVKSGLSSARLYTAGLGVYEAYINGERLRRIEKEGTVVYDELKPGYTEMRVRKLYNTYDVTDMLQAGKENVLSAVVSGGWWSDAIVARHGNEDAFLAKLVLRYADGTEEVVDTDTSWKSARNSAVLFADIFSGESYDARIDEKWRYPGFDDSAWANVKINTEFHGEISPWIGSPIVTRSSLEQKAKSVTVYRGAVGANETQYGKINVVRTYGEEPFVLEPGETAVIDFGQNFAGREAVRLEGERGTNVVIIHGEMLNDRDGLISRGNDGPEGSVYNANYRSAVATTRYIMKGCGVEDYHTVFSFYGFRYIEIAADKPITVHKVVGHVVTSVEKETGFLETSDAPVNQLISNCRWGQYSNYLSIPTDCPQRDERQGWMADTQVFAKAGCYMAFSKSFLTKFMQDIRDSQREDGAFPSTAPIGWCHGGTGWADAGIIIPYQLYRLYGDKTVIQPHWVSMQRYVDNYLGKTNKYGPQKIFGDWLAYESNDNEIQEMLGVAFYAWDAQMMQEMALAIGREEEAEKYKALYAAEKEFFCSLYVNDDGTLKRSEQSVCAYALYLDLLPDEKSAEAVKEQLTGNIIRNGNKLQTGFLGTAILLDTLTKIGRVDLAYSVLLQHDNPSWLYSVDQGATTVWERWNSYTIKDGFGDVSMNSFNHYAYGAVAGWMFEVMAGIGAAEPGFKKLLLHPHPDVRLAAKASYDSAYGMIHAESVFEGDLWYYTCTVPANTTAKIVLPAVVETVNGQPYNGCTVAKDGIVFVSYEDGNCIFEAVSGTFHFGAKL